MSKKRKNQHYSPTNRPEAVIGDREKTMADWYQEQWDAVMVASGEALDQYYGREASNGTE